MESWSTFEQRQKKTREDTSSSARRKNDTNIIGVDALYVSSSSSNIAPASATLLRHAGLNAPNNSNSSKDGTANDGGDDVQEFRLRFHWMRPHPSLAFSLEEEQGESGDIINADNTKQTKSNNNIQSTNPAVEASKLMDAYRTSQINKQLEITEEDGDNNNTSDDNKTSTIKSAPNLPLELPKLRINLASLVEPPLMSSWLPGDDDDSEE